MSLARNVGMGSSGTHVFVVSLFAVACGNDASRQDVSQPAPPGPSATGGDSSTLPVAAGVDWRTYPIEPGDYRYKQGTNLCCAKGEGDACCSIYDGDGQCSQHGGVYGGCLDEGQEGEFKFACVHCCEGLTRLNLVGRDTNGTCTQLGPPSIQVCFRCGDGICSEVENSCNCEQDCPLSD